MAKRNISEIDAETLIKFKELESKLLELNMSESDLSKNEQAYMLVKIAENTNNHYESNERRIRLLNQKVKEAAINHEIWQDYSDIYQTVYHAVPIFKNQYDDMKSQLDIVNLDLAEYEDGDDKLSERIQNGIDDYFNSGLNDNSSYFDSYHDAIVAVAGAEGTTTLHAMFCMRLPELKANQKKLQNNLSRPPVGVACSTYERQIAMSEEDIVDTEYEQFDLDFA